MKKLILGLVALVVLAIAAGAAVFWFSQESATVPVEAGYGADPALPEPRPGIVPTIRIARVDGWAEGETPVAADGLAVNLFADGFDNPRWLHVLPNGDVLVAESKKPARQDSAFSPRAWAADLLMGLAGAGGASANRITLLRDSDRDGAVDDRTVFLTGLNSPFGMALVGDTLYVANTDAIVAFPYAKGDTSIEAEGRHVADLPAGPINHHWTKDLIAAPDGRTLYATAGSNSNVGENGLEAEEMRAAVLEVDPESGAVSVFASGLRNPNGLAWHPASGELWVAVNERDEIGSDLVPDYMTHVEEGGFYGWPWSYWGVVDERVEPPRPDMVAKALRPDYALGAHTASLGLTFYDAELLPETYRGGAFIGQHGSWNRQPPSGYKVVFVPFDAAGRPSGAPQDILTGFLGEDGRARGRPVGVAVAGDGSLLVADDAGNAVWRVAPAR